MEHIPKEELIVGKRYKGRCRNATEAVWDGKQFEYTRSKFGHTFQEKIYCPEDDDVYDVFYAQQAID
ncbi:hypothetical protein FROZEN_68 [Erwinia phage vB_EamP_Frozen]|uniref:Uncharacterized protein n=2 Tax=Johnsonvirus frozen TaxID=1982578 RepID=A0A191ZDB0_9CAUD|nr:hypothetical protein FROZEN_68 [Erwinia phage vB_EamP_Frozen]ANJ65197.1 hypothetical protein FROZEN_68 [Erwinia phage vB_EamP_Frozen]ANJ65372.1 hypothetical protein GUTMEISTER_60 [Erwinia phage vB_EamP_Gutmeister]